MRRFSPRERRAIERMEKQIFKKQRKNPSLVHWTDEELMELIMMNRYQFFPQQERPRSSSRGPM
jgi:hypothetical protein